jgi:hypothetical protein
MASDIYTCLQCALIPAVKYETFYNGYQSYGMDYFARDGQSIVIGYPFIRQLRIKNSKCIQIRKLRVYVVSLFPFSKFSAEIWSFLIKIPSNMSKLVVSN